jgi:hypothetical protein
MQARRGQEGPRGRELGNAFDWERGRVPGRTQTTLAGVACSLNRSAQILADGLPGSAGIIDCLF